MAGSSTDERNAAGEWRPDGAIELAPINAWPPAPKKVAKWAFRFPGFLWPYNAFWLLVAVVTWTWLTPSLVQMHSANFRQKRGADPGLLWRHAFVFLRLPATTG